MHCHGTCLCHMASHVTVMHDVQTRTSWSSGSKVRCTARHVGAASPTTSGVQSSAGLTLTRIRHRPRQQVSREDVRAPVHVLGVCILQHLDDMVQLVVGLCTGSHNCQM